MIGQTCWKCHCGAELRHPEAFAQHRSACSTLPPTGWFEGWQGDTPPIAGRENNGVTPPGQVIIGWRDRSAA